MNTHVIASKQYVAALEAEAAAKRAVATAKELLVEASERAGRPTCVVDGKAVTITQAIRRSFSLDALRDLVDSAVFAVVTKTSVDSKSFDRLRQNGSIAATVEDAVTNGTPYVRVNITDATEAEQAEQDSASPEAL